MTETKKFAAGVFEQGENGWDEIAWSRHSSVELARRAAKKYRRQLLRSGPSTGGSLTWAAWYASDDGGTVTIDN